MSKDIVFPNHLRRLRRARGYSQKRLAMLVGLRTSRPLSDFERGRRLPPLDVAMLLEIVLGARVAEMYVGLYQRLSDDAMHREDRLPAGWPRRIHARVSGKD